MGDTDQPLKIPRRRVVLSTLSTGAVFGVAGCSTDQSGNGDGDDGGVDDTDTGTENSEDTTTQSTIPGEVVHDGLDGIEVVEHWYDGEFLYIRIRNGRSEPLQEAESFLQGGDLILGRGLSPDGEELRLTTWTGVDRRPGPSSIEAGSEATVGFPIAMGGEPARYEICLVDKSYGSSSWSELCS